jgi:hypothetical protein
VILVPVLATFQVVAFAVPNVTDVVPVNPTPVMVTFVPPFVPPLVGDTVVTTGP